MPSAEPVPVGKSLLALAEELLLPQQSKLFERVRSLHHTTVNSKHGRFVYYLMTNTLRAHDNPALEVALQLSIALDLPILVLYVINDTWPHATERRFKFILEALQSVAEDMLHRGIPFALNIQSKLKSYKPWHLTLGARAAAIVTDEPYVEPYLSMVHKISRVYAPSIAVDNACIVTPSLVGRGCLHRAYKFESVTKILRTKRLGWKPGEIHLPKHLQEKSEIYVKQNLPFDPVELPTKKSSSGNIDQALDTLLKTWFETIDFSVRSVHHTKGDRISAYKRWNKFLHSGLASYARRRNDILQHYSQGVSRMSCYLNLGIISPFAMTSALISTACSSEKFISEFHCWRELAHCFCYYNPQYLSLDKSLPSWAYKSLTEHSVDFRSQIYSLETLKASNTNDKLWNLCQRSLVETGELHNNLRMAWGKQGECYISPLPFLLGHISNINLCLVADSVAMDTDARGSI